MRKFDEFRDTVLAEYNIGKEEPVEKYDDLFMAYLIGIMSTMIDKKEYDTHIQYSKERFANVGGGK
jgi:hypothetical protein